MTDLVDHLRDTAQAMNQAVAEQVAKPELDEIVVRCEIDPDLRFIDLCRALCAGGFVLQVKPGTHDLWITKAPAEYHYTVEQVNASIRRGMDQGMEP